MPVTVDPEVRAMLDAFDDGSPFDLARARAVLDDLFPSSAVPGPAADAHDTLIAGVPVRTYSPQTDGPGLPLVWLHGGGFVTGSRRPSSSPPSSTRCATTARRTPPR